MDKWASPVAQISLERCKILLTGMEIYPYKHLAQLPRRKFKDTAASYF
jgi:hypothetical protein